jgi:hypothetical protein
MSIWGIVGRASGQLMILLLVCLPFWIFTEFYQLILALIFYVLHTENIIITVLLEVNSATANDRIGVQIDEAMIAKTLL